MVAVVEGVVVEVGVIAAITGVGTVLVDVGETAGFVAVARVVGVGTDAACWQAVSVTITRTADVSFLRIDLPSSSSSALKCSCV